MKQLFFDNITIKVIVIIWLILLDIQNNPRIRVMVFNATSKHISVLSWWSILLEKSGPTDQRQVTAKLYHIMLYREHLP